MDMLCINIYQFVDNHNNHPIRKPAKRDHYLQTGKPFETYFYPESEINYSHPVNVSILEVLESEVEEDNLNEFLTCAVVGLFQSYLLAQGHPISFSYQYQHEQAYLFL